MTRRIIVGGTSGIGRDLALRARDRGETVTVVGRDGAGLPVGVEVVVADLSLARGQAEARDALAGRRIDRLVFTAGGLSAAARVTAEGRDAAYMVNHVARATLAEALLPQVTRGGRIGFVSSWGSYTAPPGPSYRYGVAGRSGLRHALTAYVPNDALFDRLAALRPDLAILGYNPGPTRGTRLATRAETPWLLKLVGPVFTRLARDVAVVGAEFDTLLETAPPGIAWHKGARTLPQPPHLGAAPVIPHAA